MPAISVVIVTKNEEKNIRPCIESIKWADEIVIIDNCSSDSTVSICREYTDKVFEDKSLLNVTRKNLGFDKAQYGWILNIDADERVSPDLADEIKQAAANSSSNINGYGIPFKTIAFGKELKYGGWSEKDVILTRFFRKGKGRYLKEGEHVPFYLDGVPDRFKNHIVHYNFTDMSQLIDKINLYSSNQAKVSYEAGVKPYSWLHITASAVKEFLKRYIFKSGYRDGFAGFILASMFSFYILVDYFKLMEKYERGR